MALTRLMRLAVYKEVQIDTLRWERITNGFDQTVETSCL